MAYASRLASRRARSRARRRQSTAVAPAGRRPVPCRDHGMRWADRRATRRFGALRSRWEISSSCRRRRKRPSARPGPALSRRQAPWPRRASSGVEVQIRPRPRTRRRGGSRRPGRSTRGGGGGVDAAMLHRRPFGRRGRPVAAGPATASYRLRTTLPVSTGRVRLTRPPFSGEAPAARPSNHAAAAGENDRDRADGCPPATRRATSS